MQQHPHEMAANWLAQARRDLESARYLVAGERFDLACFTCQQAAEKSLKAALIWLVGDRPRTHELDALVAELERVRPGASARLGDVGALDPYYVSTRYPDAIGGGIPGMKFFAPEAALALDRAERAVTFAAAVLGIASDAERRTSAES